MNLPTAILTIRWMVRDTFRQSMASRIFWVMLLLSGIAIVFCLSVSVTGDLIDSEEMIPKEAFPHLTPDQIRKHGVDVISGKLTIGFGAISVDLGRTRQDAVRHLQLSLATMAAGTFGLLLALIWTAGFLPSFLEPSAATVLLAKPVPRWSLLVGKYLGVLVFVFFQAVIFIGGTWLALGLKTGVWDMLYLLAVPILLFHFAVFFSFSTFLAVWTRSTVTCVFGSIFFWFMCWGMNYGHHVLLARQLQDPPARKAASKNHDAKKPDSSSVSTNLMGFGYWLLPKPADMGIVLNNALKTENYFGELLEYKTLQKKGEFHPDLSLLTSLLFALIMLAIAAYEFVTTDY